MAAGLSEVLQLLEGGLRTPYSVRFEEEGHLYWIDGAPVPSVTQVVDQLHDWRGVSPEVLERAAKRGALIHRACELVARDVLDWDTVDDSIRPEVLAFSDWLEVTKFKPVLIEEVVGSKRYRFAGRLDLLGILKRGLCLIDIKSGSEFPAYSVQTAGLEIALWESMGIPLARYNDPKIRRYCLYLKGGNARLVPHPNVRDHSLFLAALTCSHYRREMYP